MYQVGINKGILGICWTVCVLLCSRVNREQGTLLLSREVSVSEVYTIFDETRNSRLHGATLTIPASMMDCHHQFLTESSNYKALDVRGSAHHSIVHIKYPTRCNSVSKFYFIFIWSSTCFGRHTAHHQEPKTAPAASGFAYVEGCWPCSCLTLSVRVWYTAHHQEPKTIPAASGFAYVESWWPCSCLTLSEYDTPPIIRSLKLHQQPLVLHMWRVVGRVVAGRCQSMTHRPSSGA